VIGSEDEPDPLAALIQSDLAKWDPFVERFGMAKE
jgi:hypothetical protein